jgi:hypothetical protein
MTLRKTAGAAAILFLLAAAGGPAAIAQEKKVDTGKLFAEIVGDYDFSFQGEFMTLAFWMDKEKLLGAPRGQEDDYAEIVPVDLENLKFEATTSEGQYFEIAFARDEAGVIAKCLLRSQGLELEGVRVKK